MTRVHVDKINSGFSVFPFSFSPRKKAGCGLGLGVSLFFAAKSVDKVNPGLGSTLRVFSYIIALPSVIALISSMFKRQVTPGQVQYVNLDNLTTGQVPYISSPPQELNTSVTIINVNTVQTERPTPNSATVANPIASPLSRDASTTTRTQINSNTGEPVESTSISYPPIEDLSFSVHGRGNGSSSGHNDSFIFNYVLQNKLAPTDPKQAIKGANAPNEPGRTSAIQTQNIETKMGDHSRKSPSTSPKQESPAFELRDGTSIKRNPN